MPSLLSLPIVRALYRAACPRRKASREASQLRMRSAALITRSRPIISDREYDRYRTRRPGGAIPISHSRFADSACGRQAAEAFAQIEHRAQCLVSTMLIRRRVQLYARITRLSLTKIPVVVEPKVDGVAVSLLYENGRLRAATREDGGRRHHAKRRTIRSSQNCERRARVFEVRRSLHG